MRRPATIVYGVNDKPPLPVVVLGAFQHAVLVTVSLAFPLLIGREAGMSGAALLDVVSIAMLVIGVGALLQASRWGPLGSGYLLPPSFTSGYIAPTILAAKAGGLAMVAGMTIFAGVIECVVSRVLRPLRPYFPPEIAGLVVIVIGIMLGAFGTRSVLGVGTAEGVRVGSLAVTVITLAAIVGLNVWGKGNWRVFSPLVGMVIGYVVSIPTGDLTMKDLEPVLAAPSVHVPTLMRDGIAFDFALAIPFAIAAIAASLGVIGDVTTCQKINDADWVRAEPKSLASGLLASGASNIVAGLLGSLAVNSMTGSVGIASATGLTSARVCHALGALFIVLAFFPKVGALLAVMPAPVLGALLWFSAAFILGNGLQVVTSRMFDARRTLVFGLAFTIALGVDLYPSIFAQAPASVRPFAGSALVLGTFVALVLNAVFRFGTRRAESLAVEPGAIDYATLGAFMQRQGAAWGARREVVDRAGFSLMQAIETIAGAVRPAPTIAVAVAFDEFRLDVTLTYVGDALPLPTIRPTETEILEAPDGEHRLAGYLLRGLADHVASTQRDGRTVVALQFDH